MPIRGETIGRAYVRILADGSGFDEDVKRQLRESHDTFQTLGEEHGDAYQKGWDDQIEKGHLDEDFQTRLEKGVGRMHAIGDQYGEHFTQGFRDQLKAEFGDLLGQQIANNLDDAIQKGASFQGIADRLENIRPEVARATEQIAADQDRIYAKQNADNEKKYSLYLQDRERLANALNDALAQQNADQEKDWDLHLQRLADMNDAYNENWRRDLDNNERDYQTHIAKLQRADQLREGSAKIHSQSLKDIDAQYRTLLNDVNKFGEGTNRTRQSFRDLNADIDTLASGMAILGATSQDSDDNLERMRRKLRGLGDESGRTGKKTGVLEEALGKMFGKGARNNFVNAIGSIMGGIGAIGDTVLNLPSKLKGIGDKIGLIFDQAGGGVSGFIALGEKIVPMFGMVGAGAIVLTGLVGTLSTALLLAAGSALALASSLAFGVVGALAPLVGLLGPVGVAFGTVALAMLAMSKAERKATLAPIRDGIKKLAGLALPGVVTGLTSALDRLSKPQGEHTIKLFQRVEHLATAAGKAVGSFIDNFAIGIRGAGLGQFIGTMTQNMQGEMAKLGRILGNSLEGFLGILSTLNRKGGPVDTLLNSMNKLTKGFGTWSVSPSAIKFFNDARDSASALWDFLKPLGALLFKILNAGKGAGDNMFTEMGNSIQKWSDSLSKRDLNQFFKDAQKMGEAIGHVVTQIGHLIAALDDPTTRQFAIGLVNSFGDVINVVASLVGWFAGLNENVQGLALAFSLALAGWRVLSGALVGSSMATFAANLANAETRMSALGGAAKGAAGVAGLGLLYDGAHRAAGGVKTLENVSGGALAGWRVGGPWGAGIGAISGLLVTYVENTHAAGEASKIAAQETKDYATQMDTLKTAIDPVTGKLNENARAVAQKFAQDNNLIKSSKTLGISQNTLLSAMNGQPAALDLIHNRMDKVWNSTDNLTTATGAQRGAISDLTSALGSGMGDLGTWTLQQRKARQEVLDNAEAMKNYGKILRGLPSKLITNVEQHGLPKSFSNLAELANKYHLTHAQIVKVLNAMKDTDKTRVHPKFKMDTKDALSKIASLRARLREADRQKTDPKLDINNKPANTKIADTLKKLGFVGKFLSQPSVLLDITKFNKNNDDVRNKVNETGKLNPKITVSANTQQASQDLTGVKTQVDNLPSSKTIDIHVNYHRVGNVPGGPPQSATGGVFYGAQTRLIGEAGPEAIVPLTRPLSLVDPAVRDLAAFARGKMTAAGNGGVTTGPITIITPIKDPVAVAQQVVNRIAAASYI